MWNLKRLRIAWMSFTRPTKVSPTKPSPKASPTLSLSLDKSQAIVPIMEYAANVINTMIATFPAVIAVPPL
jgi:hypothetical protein